MNQDAPPAIPAGWYADAHDPGMNRWWDGTAWSDKTQPIQPPAATATATAGLIVGIASIPVGLFGITGIVGLVLSILGLSRSAGSTGARKRSAWGVGLSLLGIVVSIAITAGIASSAPSRTAQTEPNHLVGASASTAPEPSESPTPTPTPELTLVPDATSMTVALGQESLTNQGFTLVLVSTDGTPVSDATGWTIVSQSPAAGSSIPAGSAVTLTLRAPAPAPAPAPVVKAPAPAPAPAQPAPAPAAPAGPGNGATALCRDGTYSFSAHHSGTCSHHGGVATWYK